MKFSAVMADTGTDTEGNLAALLNDDVASDETQGNITTVLTSLNNNVSGLAASMKGNGQRFS